MGYLQVFKLHSMNMPNVKLKNLTTYYFHTKYFMTPFPFLTLHYDFLIQSIKCEMWVVFFIFFSIIGKINRTIFCFLSFFFFIEKLKRIVTHLPKSSKRWKIQKE